MDDSSNASSSSSNQKLQPSARNDENNNIRSALHFAVGRICLAEEEEDTSPNGGARMGSEAISALTELVYQYATKSLANDLECFSKHANRRTINVDDVKLVARKDKRLHTALERFCERDDIGNSNGATAGRGRAKGRYSSATRAQRTSTSNTSRQQQQQFRLNADNKRDQNEFGALGLEQQRDQLLKEAMSSSSSSASSSDGSKSDENEFDLENTDDEDKNEENSAKVKKRKIKRLIKKKQFKSSNKRSSRSGVLSRFSALPTDDSTSEDSVEAAIGIARRRKVAAKGLSGDEFSSSQGSDFNGTDNDDGRSPTCAIDLADDD